MDGFFPYANRQFPLNSDLVDYLKICVDQGPWYQVYDLIEEFVSYGETSYDSVAERLTRGINLALVTHNSGYRLIEGIISPITATVEVEAITASLNLPDKFAGACAHIDTALQMLSE